MRKLARYLYKPKEELVQVESIIKNVIGHLSHSNSSLEPFFKKWLSDLQTISSIDRDLRLDPAIYKASGSVSFKLSVDIQPCVVFEDIDIDDVQDVAPDTEEIADYSRFSDFDLDVIVGDGGILQVRYLTTL